MQLAKQSKRVPIYLIQANNYLKITLTISGMKSGVLSLTLASKGQ